MIKSIYKRITCKNSEQPQKVRIDPVKLPIKVIERSTIKRLGFNPHALELTDYALQYYHSGNKLCFN